MKRHHLLSLVLALSTLTALPVSAMRTLTNGDADQPHASGSRTGTVAAYDPSITAVQTPAAARVVQESQAALDESLENMKAIVKQGSDLLALSDAFFKAHGEELGVLFDTLKALDTEQRQASTAQGPEQRKPTFFDKINTVWKYNGQLPFDRESGVTPTEWRNFLGVVSIYWNDKYVRPYTSTRTSDHRGKMAFHDRESLTSNRANGFQFIIEPDEDAFLGVLNRLYEITSTEFSKLTKSLKVDVGSCFFTLNNKLNELIKTTQEMQEDPYHNMLYLVEHSEDLEDGSAAAAKAYANLSVQTQAVRALNKEMQRVVSSTSLSILADEAHRKQKAFVFAPNPEDGALMVSMMTLPRVDAFVRGATDSRTTDRLRLRAIASVALEGTDFAKQIPAEGSIPVSTDAFRRAVLGQLRSLSFEQYLKLNRSFLDLSVQVGLKLPKAIGGGTPRLAIASGSASTSAALPSPTPPARQSVEEVVDKA